MYVLMSPISFDICMREVIGIRETEVLGRNRSTRRIQKYSEETEVPRINPHFQGATNTPSFIQTLLIMKIELVLQR